MTKKQLLFAERSSAQQRGVSLVIVLIMLVIIGLTSAAAIRNATSGEKVTNNIRLQSLAQQYAEAGLRYCEAELVKSDTDAAPVGRMGTALAEVNLQTVAVGGNSIWGQSASWFGNAKSATLTTVPADRITSADSSFQPTTRPQCIVEKQTLADASIVYVVTARGFSPDYSADTTAGKTTNGSVVWLQSTILTN